MFSVFSCKRSLYEKIDEAVFFAKCHLDVRQEFDLLLFKCKFQARLAETHFHRSPGGRPDVSRVRCVPGPMCPGSDVSPMDFSSKGSDVSPMEPPRRREVPHTKSAGFGHVSPHRIVYKRGLKIRKPDLPD